MFPHHKSVTHRRGDQTSSSGGSDQRERPQRHVDRAGTDAFSKRDVDAKVFHRWIEKLLHGNR